MAKFEKGNKEGAKSKPGKHAKTLQWEALGDSIVGQHAESFNDILNGYLDKDDNGGIKDLKKFLDAYLQVINYFKPKYQSTNINIEEGFVFNVKVPGEDNN